MLVHANGWRNPGPNGSEIFGKVDIWVTWHQSQSVLHKKRLKCVSICLAMFNRDADKTDFSIRPVINSISRPVSSLCRSLPCTLIRLPFTGQNFYSIIKLKVSFAHELKWDSSKIERIKQYVRLLIRVEWRQSLYNYEEGQCTNFALEGIPRANVEPISCIIS